MSLQEVIVTKLMEAGGKLKVRSALNPMLWLSAIVSVPALVLALTLMTQPPSWLIFLILSPVIVTMIGFLYLLIRDPDKLQSESYQIRKLEIEMIEEKGVKAIDPATVEAIPEPEFPILEGEVQEIEEMEEIEQIEEEVERK